MKHSLKDIPAKEIMPGFHGKMIHTPTMTHAYWHIDKGASLPVHHHHHEQVLNMLEGEFKLEVDGVENYLQTGDVYTIPSNVPHRGEAITDCFILDVFTPTREDYQ